MRSLLAWRLQQTVKAKVVLFLLSDCIATNLAILTAWGLLSADIVAFKAVLSVQQRKEPLSPNSAGKVE